MPYCVMYHFCRLACILQPGSIRQGHVSIQLAVSQQRSRPPPRLLRSISVAVLVVVDAFEQGEFEHVAERQHAAQLGVLIDDDEAVHARLADGVVDGGHAVLHGAGEDAGEVLWGVSVGGLE